MTQNAGNDDLRLYDPGLFFQPSGNLSHVHLLEFLANLGMWKRWSTTLINLHATNAVNVFETYRGDPALQRRILIEYLDSLL